MAVETPEKKQKYTITLASENGQAIRSIAIPVEYIRYGIGVLCLLVAFLGIFFVDYRSTVKLAVAQKTELKNLQQVNDFQAGQLEQLNKTAAELQQDMHRLNVLDAELRRLVNSDGSGIPVSRSGLDRTTAVYNGQGGPVVTAGLAEVSNNINQLKTNITEREQSLLELKAAITERNAKLAKTPSIMPASGQVTSRFGWRSSPWGGSGTDWHPGIDIANDYGTPIYAAADGYVVFSGWNGGGYGKLIQIDHGNGIETLYGHNSVNLVQEGDSVKKGQVIGYMGSTGYSTGPHVHYEVRVNGMAVDPAKFL